MKATFRISEHEEIQVESLPDSQCVQIKFCGVDGGDSRNAEEYCLSKSQARAIASAMMGCAAEL